MDVLFLVGPKGAGKSTVLQRMQDMESPEVRYIPSEALFLQARDDHRLAADTQTESIYTHDGTTWVDGAYELITQSIAAAGADATAKLAVCESTGTPPQFAGFVRAMRTSYNVVLVHMSAPLEVCAERIAQRTLAGHLPASRELIESVHTASMALLTEGLVAAGVSQPTGLPTFALELDSWRNDVNACAVACFQAVGTAIGDGGSEQAVILPDLGGGGGGGAV